MPSGRPDRRSQALSRPAFSLIAALLAGLLLLPLFPAWAQNGIPPVLSSESVLLLDSQGSVLFSKNSESEHAPASLVKLMTLYLALEDLEAGRVSWDETVTVSARAARTPRYRMGLRAGEKVPFRVLLEGVSIASANDAATALSEHPAGDEEEFVARMNATAERIGLTQTRFANPHGLPDPNQRSTARDLAVLVERLLQDYPKSRTILGGGNFVYRGRVYSRQIPLFKHPGGVQALKTGFTSEAGYNLAVAAGRNGQRFLGVLLGAQSRNLSFLDAQKLFKYGFAQAGMDSPEEERLPPAKKRSRVRVSIPPRSPSESGPGGFR